MIFRPYYYFDTGYAVYLLGCGGLGKCCVVDAREEDVDAYHQFAASPGIILLTNQGRQQGCS